MVRDKVVVVELEVIVELAPCNLDPSWPLASERPAWTRPGLFMLSEGREKVERKEKD